jgi:septal ring factor EnvC (AmiA/AmiB activator)
VLLFALLLILGCLLASTPAPAAESRKAEEIRRELERIQIRAREKRGAVRELTKRERELFSNLAELETKVNTLELEVYRQERQMERTERKKSLLLARQVTLQAGRERSEAELREILKVLWPIHMSGARDHWQGLTEWQEADRHFTWLAAIYKRAEQVMADILNQSRAIEDTLASEIALTRELQEGMTSLNSAKDELLTKKLTLLKSIQEVRAEQVDEQEELRRILATVEELDYTLKTLDKSPIRDFKGKLPWPCRGSLVQAFDPRADSPSRGIGLAVPHEVDINAVSWGRVVHNDRLRGFGHVVIVLHDQEYYSLYAYLANSRVKVGQEVERGQALGTAGYYPLAKGNGLYFELRFGQKPINPLDWLSR